MTLAPEDVSWTGRAQADGSWRVEDLAAALVTSSDVYAAAQGLKSTPELQHCLAQLRRLFGRTAFLFAAHCHGVHPWSLCHCFFLSQLSLSLPLTLHLLLCCLPAACASDLLEDLLALTRLPGVMLRGLSLVDPAGAAGAPLASTSAAAAAAGAGDAFSSPPVLHMDLHLMPVSMSAACANPATLNTVALGVAFNNVVGCDIAFSPFDVTVASVFGSADEGALKGVTRALAPGKRFMPRMVAALQAQL